jgi:HTH-type transcriptional regulator/antitoxin HigA
MDWKVLKSEEVYQKAVKRALELFHYESGTEVEELELLLVLIKDYEEKHISIPALNPLEVIKLKMKEQGLKNKDLESIIGSKGHVSSILSGRRDLTLTMAKRLKKFFNLPADIFFQNA